MPGPEPGPGPDVVRRRKLMAMLLLAIDQERDDRPLRWRLVIRNACVYGNRLDATPAEFNRLLSLTVREVIGGTGGSDATSAEREPPVLQQVPPVSGQFGGRYPLRSPGSVRRRVYHRRLSEAALEVAASPMPEMRNSGAPVHDPLPGSGLPGTLEADAGSRAYRGLVVRVHAAASSPVGEPRPGFAAGRGGRGPATSSA